MANGDETTFDEIATRVAGWVQTAFPNRRCPKCDNDKFFVLDPPPQPLAPGELTYAAWPVTKLACQRCGFIEEHVTGILKKTLEDSGNAPISLSGPRE